mgnify:CR=1 FL=1
MGLKPIAAWKIKNISFQFATLEAEVNLFFNRSLMKFFSILENTHLSTVWIVVKNCTKIQIHESNGDTSF